MYSVIIIKGHSYHRLKPRPYEEALDVFHRAVERFGEDHVFWVSTKTPYPAPEDHVRRGKLLWCPYCGTQRLFEIGPLGFHRCTVCRMSEKDFHVIRANDLRLRPLRLPRRRRVRKEVEEYDGADV